MTRERLKSGLEAYIFYRRLAMNIETPKSTSLWDAMKKNGNGKKNTRTASDWKKFNKFAHFVSDSFCVYFTMFFFSFLFEHKIYEHQLENTFSFRSAPFFSVYYYSHTGIFLLYRSILLMKSRSFVFVLASQILISSRT